MNAADPYDHQERHIEAPALPPTMAIHGRNSSSWHMIVVQFLWGNIHLLICAGLIGHLISYVTFRMSPFKGRASSTYLRALAVSEFCFLSFLLSLQFKILRFFHAFCPILMFLAGVFTVLPGWFTVSYMTDRYIGVCKPTRRLLLCTERRAQLVMFTLIGLSLLLYSPLLVVFVLDRFEGRCPETQLSLWIYTILIYTLLTFLAPVVIIIVLNLKIFLAVCSRHNDAESCNPSRDTPAASDRLLHGSVASGTSSPVSGIGGRSQDKIAAQEDLRIDTAVEVPETRMLLLASTLYLLTNISFHALLLSAMEFKMFDPLQCAAILYLSKSPLNFIMYNVSSPAFRKVEWYMLKSCWIKLKHALTTTKKLLESSKSQKLHDVGTETPVEMVCLNKSELAI